MFAITLTRAHQLAPCRSEVLSTPHLLDTHSERKSVMVLPVSHEPHAYSCADQLQAHNRAVSFSEYAAQPLQHKSGQQGPDTTVCLPGFIDKQAQMLARVLLFL